MRALATPIAVEIFPSIPASPRLAKVSIPVRALANASISRIGLEDETNNVVPFLIVAATVRANTGSDH